MEILICNCIVICTIPERDRQRTGVVGSALRGHKAKNEALNYHAGKERVTPGVTQFKFVVAQHLLLYRVR